MVYDSSKHNRRSIRLKGYDYSQAGAYFLTICTRNRECLFGNVSDEQIILNDAGCIVMEEWSKSSIIRDEIESDAFVVMPNHIHGILFICRGDRPVAPSCSRNRLVVNLDLGDQPVAPTREPIFASCPKPRSVGSFIAGFKSATTKRINQLNGTQGTPVWQRNYYEHIIRNEKELQNVREYILNNPLQWAYDRENPESIVVVTGRIPLQDEPWYI